jgi:hypothetical protein
MQKHFNRWAARAGACAAGLVLSTAVLAQTPTLRSVPIPDGALRGVASPAVFPAVVINGKAARLAAGARIFGTNNLLVMPNALPAESPVAVVLENSGDIKTMWVLTAQEQQVKRNKF